MTTTDEESSWASIFENGETGGDIGNAPFGFGYSVFFGVSIVGPGDARAKLSCGVASGGDMRLEVILNGYLGSIIPDRLILDMGVLMNDEGGIEEVN